MKQRFSSLDIKVITHELSELVDLRVSNIYDLSSRIFLFKLAKPDHRRQLLVDSGFRCHITQYSRTTAAAPSNFVSRLRKFLRSRRLTSISQIGTDRIIDLVFSDGAYHLFLEFFAGGNIILTDHEYTILSVFRQVSIDEGEETRVGLKYTVTNKQNYEGVPDITTQRIRATIEDSKAALSVEEGVPKKSKKKGQDALRKALSRGFPEYPPLLLDHAFAVTGFDPTVSLDQALEDDCTLLGVKKLLEEAQLVSSRLSVGDHSPGYIIARKKTPRNVDAGDVGLPEATDLLYEDFHPFRPRQFEYKPEFSILEFNQFNTAVDEYFSSIESQKLESKLAEREYGAKRKLNSMRLEHERRIGELKDVQSLQIRKAAAIESNVYRVQEAMDAVNSLIAQGMDWVEIARLIDMEQVRGNPIANIIKLPLKLYENTITLALGEAECEDDADDRLSSGDESDEEPEYGEKKKQKEEEESILTVDIDLGLSPWANATQYYDQKKAAALKEQKTAQSSTKALKSHEDKVNRDLQRSLKLEKQTLRPARQPFWFEKFTFFISSEGYLVLCGRDAVQTEVLYRRHLKKGDIFVHADVKGAIPVVIKNRPGCANAPIPPSTLSQAGSLCVTTSSAWDSKAVMSAWWVPANEVSKMTVGGILPPGDFSVKGEKNFLAPSQLILGFAVIFQISQESLQNHKIRHFTGLAEVAQEGTETSVKCAKGLGAPEKEVKTVVPEEDMDRKQESCSDQVDGDKPIYTVEFPKEKPTQEQGGPQIYESDAHGSEDHAVSLSCKIIEDKEVKEAEALADELTQETETPTPESQSRQENTPDSVIGDHSRSPASARAVLPSRAKKGKSKRAATKYAQQDDDERELALQLIGAKSVKAQKAVAAAEAKARQEKEAQAQKERRRAQHERAAEAERRRQLALGERADDYDEQTAMTEAADLTLVSTLVGTPHPDDEILAAIPVCAPWAALGQYKYRVKLQPGTVKKGKAVKEIHNRWIAESTTGKIRKDLNGGSGTDIATAEKLRAQEGELLKGWKDSEIVNTLPVGKVRVIMPGGETKGKSKGPTKGGTTGKGGKKR